MTKKITTEVCKKALLPTWQEIFGTDTDLSELASKWKRMSKRGKEGESIELVFYHKSLPLQALVVEENGAVARTVIRGFAPFDADEENSSPAEIEMLTRAMATDGFEFLSRYACYRPSDFIFSLCTEEQAKADGTWYELYPTRDFGRTDCPYDEQLDYLIAHHLPEGDGEATEGTFTSERSIEETREELVKRGFIPTEEYVATSRVMESDEDD